VGPTSIITKTCIPADDLNRCGRCERCGFLEDIMQQDYFCHATSIIDEGCAIGKGTRIWHFCHLMSGCRIGEDCSLGQNVFVGSNVILGNNVKVQNNVSIYEGVICEDDVFLGPSMVFTNVINPRSAITRKSEFRKTVVRKGVTIGANATIVCGNEIGAYAFIGAGAVITKTVPAYAVIVGNPGRQRGWMSEAGHPLIFENGEAVCKGSGEVYILKEGSVFKNNNN
jgi:UDP-2-acetamido-3-amino-2,3-dideoxy-glucuronate N-acetyltransferase